MFRMMLNAADRMVDKLKLRLSEKDRQIHDLQEEVKHLKQVIVDARMTESRLVATMEEDNQKWNSICNRWRQRAEDAEFKVMTLESSTKRQHLESTLEKLLNVSNKLDSAETKVVHRAARPARRRQARLPRPSAAVVPRRQAAHQGTQAVRRGCPEEVRARPCIW